MMKKYIKAFYPDFRSVKGPSCSFELTDFDSTDSRPPLQKGDQGIYIISATNGIKFTYANGLQSPIIYIGKSDDLLRRLRDEHYYKHLRVLIEDKDWGISVGRWMPSKYQYMYYNGCHVDVFKCLGKQDSKDLESIFLWRFYQKYKALPVGNNARSYPKAPDESL